MSQPTEAEFEKAADRELTRLVAALDAAALDVEVELSMGVLTLEFGDGTKYVVNSHRAAKQIWLAAERSAWHFDPDASGSTWVAPKSGDELWATLRGVLGRKLGKDVALAP
jgi:CyaY protein